MEIPQTPIKTGIANTPKEKQLLKSFLAGFLVVGGLVVASAQIPQGALPLDPSRERGASITPAFEGWYPNPDGRFTLLIGYYNRNTKQTLDIPVGADNKIEPGPADQGQPTYFEVGRQWECSRSVPKDFGTRRSPGRLFQTARSSRFRCH